MGLPVRGAVVLGKLYWPEKDENIILGPAMIDAYNLESTVAIYPRIVINEGLYEYIKDEKNKVYANPLASERLLLKDFIRRDEDGVLFFDILNRKITRKVGEKVIRDSKGKKVTIAWNSKSKDTWENIIENVRSMIDNCMNQKPDLHVMQKYEWLQTYLDSVRGESSG